ncbi:MAG: exo-alpha-sialidase, partial [Acidobacteriota bacterium]
MSERLLIGTRKGLFTAERDGSASWHIRAAAFLGDPVTIVLPLADGKTVYAALRLGHFGVKLHRSRDRGLTWEELAAPAYPEKPPDVEDIDPMRKTPIPWSTDLIWSLESGGEDVLWCGTIPGGLFRSEDAGGSWTLIRALWDRPERTQWFGGGYD